MGSSTLPVNDSAITAAYHDSEYPALGISLDEAMRSDELRKGLALRSAIADQRRKREARRCSSWFDHCAEQDAAHRASIFELHSACGVVA